MDQSLLDSELRKTVSRLARRMGTTGKVNLYSQAEELVRAGASVNQKIGRKGPLLGLILLLWSAKEKESLVRVFIEHGADVNAPVTGLFLDMCSRGMDTLRVHFTHLIQIAAGQPVLWNSSGEIIQLLVKHGADLNTKTREGLTALDMAMTQLWLWEQWFEDQKIRVSKRYCSDEIETGFNILTYTPPLIDHLLAIRDLGGTPSVWTMEQVVHCALRMTRIQDACIQSRSELVARVAAAGMPPEEYLPKTLMAADDPARLDQMDVGPPTRLLHVV